MSLPLGRVLPRQRMWIALVTVLIVATLTTTVLTPRHSSTPYAVDNPGADGAHALAALLADEGVDVVTARTVEEAIDTATGTESTLALLHTESLTPLQRERIGALGIDITIVGTRYGDLDGLVPARTVTLDGTTAPASASLTAACDDPDAQAAGQLTGPSGALALTPTGSAATGCFMLPGTESDPRYGYVSLESASGGALRIIAEPDLVTNARLAQAGHAALAVRALGHHPTLVWLDASQAAGALTLWDTTAVPPWVPVLGLHALLMCALAVIVHGRRFGPLVEEDLPVPVQPTETTRGRARLYRVAGARGHAATALRSGTAARLGRRLAVPAGAGRAALTEAVAAASGRDEHEVTDLLYGPDPADDHALTTLATALDRLEDEVDLS